MAAIAVGTDISSTIGTGTLVRTVTASKDFLGTIRVVNRNTTAVNVRLSIKASDTSYTGAVYLEYLTQLAGNGVLLNDGLGLPAGTTIHASASAANVGCAVIGLEDDE
jgi:hypothetical protein